MKDYVPIDFFARKRKNPQKRKENWAREKWFPVCMEDKITNKEVRT